MLQTHGVCALFKQDQRIFNQERVNRSAMWIKSRFASHHQLMYYIAKMHGSKAAKIANPSASTMRQNETQVWADNESAHLYCFFVENTHFGSVNLFKIHRSFQNYHGLENRTVGCWDNANEKWRHDVSKTKQKTQRSIKVPGNVRRSVAPKEKKTQHSILCLPNTKHIPCETQHLAQLRAMWKLPDCCPGMLCVSWPLVCVECGFWR